MDVLEGYHLLMLSGFAASSISVAHLSWIWLDRRDIWGQKVADPTHGMAMMGASVLLLGWLTYCLVYLSHTRDSLAGLLIPFIPIFGFFMLGIGYVLGGFVGGIIGGLLAKTQ